MKMTTMLGGGLSAASADVLANDMSSTVQARKVRSGIVFCFCMDHEFRSPIEIVAESSLFIGRCIVRIAALDRYLQDIQERKCKVRVGVA